jgi:hypothetical protein
LFPESSTPDRRVPQDLNLTARHFNADENDKSNHINADYFVSRLVENRLVMTGQFPMKRSVADQSRPNDSLEIFTRI